MSAQSTRNYVFCDSLKVSQRVQFQERLLNHLVNHLQHFHGQLALGLEPDELEPAQQTVDDVMRGLHRREYPQFLKLDLVAEVFDFGLGVSALGSVPLPMSMDTDLLLALS
jgi:hypothetical protein